jgi:predicted RNA-binding Zn ribbon-like protein
MGSSSLSHSSATGKWLCLEFTNSIENYRLSVPLDDIPDFARWVAWSRRHGVTSPEQELQLVEWGAKHEAGAGVALADAHTLRIQLFRLLSARAAGAVPTDAQLQFLNERLPESLEHLRVAAEESDLVWPGCLLRPIVRSASELLTGAECAQLRQCGGDKCTWLFVDHSKNQSRRWCDMKICGNRAKSRKHYQKTRTPAA